MRELIAYGLETTYARVMKCVEDLSEDEVRENPAGLATVIWQLGHLVVSDAGYLSRAGGRVEIPEGYGPLFKTGTGGIADYPTLSEVRQYFGTIQRGLLEAARTTDLSRPVEGRSYRTAGEVLIFTGYHRGYHVGKMTTLRAILGKPRVFG